MTPSQTVYHRIFLISAIFLGMFLLGRLALWLIYQPSFTELGFAETLLAFIHGIRFDAAITITFLGIPFLLMMLPHRWFTSRPWQGLIYWYAYIVLIGFVFLTISDLIYFGFVQRHTGPEVTLITGDMELMLDMLLNEHRLALIIFTVSIIAGALFWSSLFKAKIALPDKTLPRYSMILIAFIVVIIVGRGGLQYKPARIADAFLSGSTASGYLTLNGPFAIFHSARGTRPVVKTFMPMPDAVKLVRHQISSSGEKYIDENYPLLRTTAPQHVISTKKPNVVIFLLESWDAIHLDYFRKQKGLKPYAITPNFNELMQKGRLYTNFYSAGIRSMDGIAALLAAVPTLPGMPYIGTGMAQNRLSYLAELAKEQNYKTIFMQSSKRGSFRLDSVAQKAGFETYLGAEDIPPAHKDAPPKKKWGVWDYSTFMEANRQFANVDGSFIGFIFSSSTHNPWRVPGKQWKRFPENSEHNKYMNSLHYSDWALGQFMQEASKHDYYKDTIFIITGDHISGFELKPNDIPGRYHIPLLIVGPGITPGIDTRTGSQLDVIPSIVDIGGWKSVHSSLGRSLFDENGVDQRINFSVNGNIINMIQRKNWLSHNLHRRLDKNAGASKDDILTMEKQIQAIHQIVMKGMLENRIYRPPHQLSSR